MAWPGAAWLGSAWHGGARIFNTTTNKELAVAISILFMCGLTFGLFLWVISIEIRHSELLDQQRRRIELLEQDFDEQRHIDVRV